MIAFQLLPFAIHSRPESVVGIGWGSSRAKASRLMLERRGVRTDVALSEETLGFDGGFFAGIPAPRYQLGFAGDRFSHLLVYFVADSRAEADRLYSRLLQYVMTRFCFLVEQPADTDGTRSHLGRGTKVGVVTGLTRIDQGWLVDLVVRTL